MNARYRNIKYKIPYHSEHEKELPHVIKFSGGRSSALMLMLLLDNNCLNAERGDVVIFNNTSAEHPKTYDFARKCTQICESLGIPCYWLEWYLVNLPDKNPEKESSVTPKPTYRIVGPEIALTKGEVFEAVVSHNTMLPNRVQRLCTKEMKINTTKRFLKDYFAGVSPDLGTLGEVDPFYQYRQYINRGGQSFSFEEYCRIKKYSWDFAGYRHGCKFDTFPGLPNLDNDYVSFIGFRADEIRRQHNFMRVAKQRGDAVHMPLVDLNFGQAEVINYWENQDFDFDCPPEVRLSNCTYCFLKGGAHLQKVHQHIEDEPETPNSVEWWRNMERKYSRYSKPEKGKTELGFFGPNKNLYEEIIKAGKGEKTELTLFDDLVPCDCTD